MDTFQSARASTFLDKAQDEMAKEAALTTPIPILEDPFELFRQWMTEAESLGILNPNSMCLATVDANGQPDARMVLLKGIDDRGFVFYTNFNSAKATQIHSQNHGALCFYWNVLGKQVRVRGATEVVTPEEADSYFASRPRQSRLGAWASAQSSEIESRAVLEARLRELDRQYQDKEVPRPPHWSGFRLLPEEIEFWKEGEYRLHDRLLYRRKSDGGWETAWLSP